MFANSFKRTQQLYEPILKNHAEAQIAAASAGHEKVIDGTLGALMRDGQLVTFPSIDRIIPELDTRQYSAYTPLQGTADFLEAVEYFCFGEYRSAKRVEAVAVAGANAGIHHAVSNYTEPGDIVLTADWYWSAYQTIVGELRRRLGFFRLFRDRRFCQESFEESVLSLAQLQQNIFILLNTPGHNPTGYSISLSEWDAIVQFLNTVKRRIILCIDTAYLDYAPAEYKQMFQKFDSLNDNVLVIAAYSISKGFAKYGLRTAALFALHNDREITAEFQRIITITNQAVYASPPSLGQYLTAALYKDRKAVTEYLKDKRAVELLLRRRADVLINAVDEYLLTPYTHGFFISIRTDRGEQMVNQLKRENIFLAPVCGGIRVALCSVDEDKLPIVADAVMRRM